MGNWISLKSIIIVIIIILIENYIFIQRILIKLDPIYTILIIIIIIFIFDY